MKRNIMKRAAACLAAAVLAVSMFSGCSQTDFSMTANGEKINAGVYIDLLLNEMSNQMYTMYYSQTITDPAQALEQEIDGKNFKTYVKEQALKSTKEFAAINAKFDELGLKLSKDDKSEAEEQTDSTWEQSQEFYESEGISKESLLMIAELSYKRQAIFDYYYAEGGIEEVSDDDIQTYVNDNYIRYKQIAFSKSTEEDETAAETENKDIKAKAEDYLKKAEGVDYDGFDAIIEEYEAEQAAEEEAEETEDTADTEDTSETDTADESSQADTSEAEESSSDAEDSQDSADDSLTEVEDTLSQAEADTDMPIVTGEVPAQTQASQENEDINVIDLSDESEVSIDDITADDSEAEDTDSTEDSTAEDTSSDESSDSEDTAEEESTEEDAAAEEEEHDHDTVVNYTDGTDTESETYDETYANRLKAIKDLEYGKASMYDDENAYYVIISADIADKTDYVTDNRDSLLDEMKGDEFQKLIDGWVDAMDIKVNNQAVKRYSVQEVYDRQEKYYSENGS